MGIFDCFIAEASCPYCKKNSVGKFQSKRFLYLTDSYKIGDVFHNIEGNHKNAAYMNCEFCDHFFYVDIIIKDGKFAGVANPTKEEDLIKV